MLYFRKPQIALQKQRPELEKNAVRDVAVVTVAESTSPFDILPERCVIAIDGSACSGKTTLARIVAKRLGILHLNSGMFYRILGRECLMREVPPYAEDKVSEICHSLIFHYTLMPDFSSRLMVGNCPVEGEHLTGLLSEEVADVASRVALLASVRSHFFSLQHAIRDEYRRLVVEGRDAGSVVFPDAYLKYFVDAPLGVRASRRYKQLLSRGRSTSQQTSQPASQPAPQLGVPDYCATSESEFVVSELSLEEIREQIISRDSRDETRAIAPQKPAPDAVLLDSHALSTRKLAALIISNAGKRPD